MGEWRRRRDGEAPGQALLEQLGQLGAAVLCPDDRTGRVGSCRVAARHARERVARVGDRAVGGDDAEGDGLRQRRVGRERRRARLPRELEQHRGLARLRSDQGGSMIAPLAECTSGADGELATLLAEAGALGEVGAALGRHGQLAAGEVDPARRALAVAGAPERLSGQRRHVDAHVLGGLEIVEPGEHVVEQVLGLVEPAQRGQVLALQHPGVGQRPPHVEHRHRVRQGCQELEHVLGRHPCLLGSPCQAQAVGADRLHVGEQPRIVDERQLQGIDAGQRAVELAELSVQVGQQHLGDRVRRGGAREPGRELRRLGELVHLQQPGHQCDERRRAVTVGPECFVDGERRAQDGDDVTHALIRSGGRRPPDGLGGLPRECPGRLRRCVGGDRSEPRVGTPGQVETFAPGGRRAHQREAAQPFEPHHQQRLGRAQVELHGDAQRVVEQTHECRQLVLVLLDHRAYRSHMGERSGEGNRRIVHPSGGVEHEATDDVALAQRRRASSQRLDGGEDVGRLHRAPRDGRVDITGRGGVRRDRRLVTRREARPETADDPIQLRHAASPRTRSRPTALSRSDRRRPGWW